MRLSDQVVICICTGLILLFLIWFGSFEGSVYTALQYGDHITCHLTLIETCKVVK